MNFKEKISIHYTSLTPTEKRICTMIFDNPQIIIKNSIVEAGVLCHTSKSAILRFAKKLEYRGYSEFKYAVEEYYNKTHNDQPIPNNQETVLQQISTSYAQTIEALGLLDYEDKLKELASLPGMMISNEKNAKKISMKASGEALEKSGFKKVENGKFEELKK